MRDTLKQFLEHHRSPSEVRAANRQRVSSENRSWSLTKGPRLQLPVGFSWSQTILAVDDTTAAQYCQDIEQWARGVLAGAVTL